MDAEMLRVLARAIADYGVLTLGWIAWLWERRRNTQLTDKLISFLAKTKMLEGYAHHDDFDKISQSDEGAGRS